MILEHACASFAKTWELKIEALVQRRLIGVDQPGYGLDLVIMESRNGNFASENEFKAEIDSLAEEEKASINIGYLQWEKIKQTEISKNTGKVKGDDESSKTPTSC